MLQRLPGSVFEGAARRVQTRCATLSLEELCEYKVHFYPPLTRAAP